MNKKLIFVAVCFLSVNVWAESSVSQRYSCAMSLLPQSQGQAVAIGELILLPTEKNLYIYSNKTAYVCSPNLKRKSTPECVTVKLKVDTKMIYANVDESSLMLENFREQSGKDKQYLSLQCLTKKLEYLEVQCKNRLDEKSKELLMNDLKVRVDSTVRVFDESRAELVREAQAAEKRPPDKNQMATHRSFFVEALEQCKPVVELHDSIYKALSSIGHRDESGSGPSQHPAVR